jgi:hypothetical protein
MLIVEDLADYLVLDLFLDVEFPLRMLDRPNETSTNKIKL